MTYGTVQRNDHQGASAFTVTDLEQWQPVQGPARKLQSAGVLLKVLGQDEEIVREDSPARDEGAVQRNQIHARVYNPRAPLGQRREGPRLNHFQHGLKI